MYDSSVSSVRLFLPDATRTSTAESVGSAATTLAPGATETTDKSAENTAAAFATATDSAAGVGGKPLVIIWPGFGVGARYYDPIARELASRGFAVATGELHGQGSSTAVASKKATWGYHHTASQDYPQTVRAVKEELGLPEDYPTIFLCHSMGGQMASLFMARPEAQQLGVKGFLGVGTGTPYYQGFRRRQHWRLRFGPLLIRLVVKLKGYQPEGLLDLSGYGRQARDHLLEWIRYSQTNRLHPLRDADIDYEAAMREVTAPILLTRMVDDDDCPMGSARNLATALPKADIRVEEIDARLGHNRWAREPQVVSDRFEEFVAEVMGW